MSLVTALGDLIKSHRKRDSKLFNPIIWVATFNLSFLHQKLHFLGSCVVGFEGNRFVLLTIIRFHTSCFYCVVRVLHLKQPSRLISLTKENSAKCGHQYLIISFCDYVYKSA